MPHAAATCDRTMSSLHTPIRCTIPACCRVVWRMTTSGTRSSWLVALVGRSRLTATARSPAGARQIAAWTELRSVDPRQPPTRRSEANGRTTGTSEATPVRSGHGSESKRSATCRRRPLQLHSGTRPSRRLTRHACARAAGGSPGRSCRVVRPALCCRRRRWCAWSKSTRTGRLTRRRRSRIRPHAATSEANTKRQLESPRPDARHILVCLLLSLRQCVSWPSVCFDRRLLSP